MMIVTFGLIVLALLFGAMLLRLYKRKNLQLAYNLLMLALLASFAIYSLATGAEGTSDVFALSPFSLYFILLFSVSMALANLLAYNSSMDFVDFAVLSDFSLAGMFVVALSTTLIGIFLGLELMTLPSAFAILLNRKSIEAAVKFFIVAALSIAIFSFGIALFYGATGAVSLSGLQRGSLLFISGMLLVVAIGFEASVFPFNIWVPDVYEGSPSYVTSMLGGINKKAGIAALLEVSAPMLIFGYEFSGLIAVFATLTMFYGNLSALMQTSIKRLFAYSSISQAGYMLIGIAAASSYGIEATLFQIFAHMFAFIGIFAIVIMLEMRGRTRINDFIGLSGENRIIAAALIVFILALIGIPFTDGFVGKFLLFSGAIYSHLLWLAILGILNSAISVFYYARVIMAVYTKAQGRRALSASKSIYVVVIVALTLTLVFGIYPAPLINLASAAALAVFH